VIVSFSRRDTRDRSPAADRHGRSLAAPRRTPMSRYHAAPTPSRVSACTRASPAPQRPLGASDRAPTLGTYVGLAPAERRLLRVTAKSPTLRARQTGFDEVVACVPTAAVMDPPEGASTTVRRSPHGPLGLRLAGICYIFGNVRPKPCESWSVQNDSRGRRQQKRAGATG
jgi:hypothetical protein